MTKSPNFITTEEVSWSAYIIGGTLAFFWGGYKFIENEKNKISEKLKEVLDVANESAIKVNELQGEVNLMKQDNKRVEEILTTKFDGLAQLVTTKIDHYEKTNVVNRATLVDGIKEIKEMLENDRK